jgi:hypothetical protein
MIIDLLALLIILGACVVMGIIITIRRREHERAEQLADEERLAEDQELYAAWATVHAYSHGSPEPSGVHPRDRLPV